MPNALFRAKEVWDGGDRQSGLAILQQDLESEINQVAFEPEPRLFFPDSFGQFEGAVFSMLDSATMLKAPFGLVYAPIWRMDPSAQWIGLLRHHTFNDPLDFEEFADLELPPLEFAFPAIVDTLTASARTGLLAPDYEGPNNGRPVLRMADVDEIDDAQWGELKPMLRSALPAAYAESPVDFWERLADDDSEGVVVRFLHDLFLDHRPALDLSDTRWKLIVEQQPPYAAAVQRALEKLRASDHPVDYLTELVRIDAGLLVDDGRAWLDQLQDALARGELMTLQGRRWPPNARL
jgi:hypothetical protein